ncbi:hypothetical protein C9374_006877 [Naegleria lovaniensis]|uniref:ABC transporter n=1 Tax=Naegleria lovaniensis TaxID=51637 RepID=A0AA88H3V2_NAELO|nr:uncharacterized protein C9374_006877 [Naegleria lovaniensis]KAG2393346.1 hypothetical protein C9374_006877 [Naegleria lovaniensis]
MRQTQLSWMQIMFFNHLQPLLFRRPSHDASVEDLVLNKINVEKQTRIPFENAHLAPSELSGENGEIVQNMSTFMKRFLGSFMWSLIPLFISKICQLAQTVLVSHILLLIDTRGSRLGTDQNNETHNHYDISLALCCLLLFIDRLLIGITLRWHFNVQTVFSHQISYYLYSSSYMKCVRAQKRVGLNISAISSEISQIEKSVSQAHSLVSHLFHLFGAMAIIHYQYQSSLITTTFIIICSLSIPLNMVLQSKNSSYTNEKTNYSNQRINLLSHFLNCFKQVKSFVWESTVIEKISRIRNIEGVYLFKLYWVDNIIACIWYIFPFVITCSLLLSSKLLERTTDEKTIFTILILLDGISVPIFELPKCLNQVMYASQCLHRLGSLLHSMQVDERPITENGESKSDTNLLLIPQNSTLTISGKASKVSMVSPFFIQPKEWISLRGRTSSGKTSLIVSILERIAKVSNANSDIQTKNNLEIIYSPQEPFIMNDTIKENIIFGLPYQQHIFEEAVKDSQLELDVTQWRSQECSNKLCGYFGNNLSGGQKIRINLARCLYRYYYLKENKNDVSFLLIFDELFNALDPTVAEVVMDTLVNTLKDVPNVSVFFTSCDNRYDHLMDRVYDAVEGNISEGSIKKEERVMDGSTLLRGHFKRSHSDLRMDESKPSKSERVVDRLLSLYDIAKFYLLSQTNLFTGVTVISLLAISQLFKSSTGIVFSNFNSYTYLFWILGLVRILVELGLGYFWSLKCYRTNSTIHENALDKILHVPLSFFVDSSGKKRKTEKNGRYGDVVERFSTNMASLDRSIPWLLKEAAQKYLECFGSLATLLLYISEANLLVVFFSFLIMIGIILYSRKYYRLYSKTRDDMSLLLSEKRAIMSQFFMESTHPTAVLMIQVYNQVPYFYQKFTRSVAHTMNISYVFNSCTDWLGVRLECLISLLLFIPFMYLIQAVCEGDCDSLHKQKLYYAGILLSTCIEFFNRFLWTLVVTTRVECELPFIGKIIEFGKLQTEQEEQGNECQSLPTTCNAQLELENVSYENILSNLSCQFKYGSINGIIGRTGSGKSFTLSLIHRFWFPLQGKILFCDHGIFEYELCSYRSKVTMIPQDTSFLLGSSLREHIDEHKLFSDHDILQALNLLGVDYITSHDLNAIINKEEDMKIEKVMIFLARVYLLVTKLTDVNPRKPKILMLDEITASMDIHHTRNVISCVKLLCTKEWCCGRVTERSRLKSYSLFRISNENMFNTKM